MSARTSFSAPTRTRWSRWPTPSWRVKCSTPTRSGASRPACRWTTRSRRPLAPPRPRPAKKTKPGPGRRSARRSFPLSTNRCRRNNIATGGTGHRESSRLCDLCAPVAMCVNPRKHYRVPLAHGGVLDLGACPLVMGILNVTPDSFADAERLTDPARAVALALQMEADGADLIHIGGAATRPCGEPVSADEEAARVLPV